jgi:NAD(P)H-dependent FMN reductase
MNLLALNGSPKTDGTVAALLDEVTRAAKEGGARTDRVDVYGLQVAPCIGCMACRPDKECVLEEDDGHAMARRLPECDGLVVATPTYWANMSSPLKALFDRIVPAIMGESDKGLPVPRHKGKPAVIVTACTTPWPFSMLLGDPRAATGSVGRILKMGGYSTVGKVVQPGTKRLDGPTEKTLRQAHAAGQRMVG